VGFQQAAVPKLEVLQANRCTLVQGFPGLHYLTSLKEIRMDRYGPKEIVQNQLAEHPNNVILKLL
jgi:hypothetical protein